MKLCRCPVCHSDINLDQLLEDDAGRELLGLMADLKSGIVTGKQIGRAHV